MFSEKALLFYITKICHSLCMHRLISMELLCFGICWISSFFVLKKTIMEVQLIVYEAFHYTLVYFHRIINVWHFFSNGNFQSIFFLPILIFTFFFRLNIKMYIKQEFNMLYEECVGTLFFSADKFAWVPRAWEDCHTPLQWFCLVTWSPFWEV